MEHHVDGQIPRLVRHPVQPRIGGEAGIVHQDVEAAIRIACGSHDGLAHVFVGDAAGGRDPAHLGGSRVGHIRVEIVDDHRRALRGEPLRNCQSYAAARTGDDCDTVGE